MMVPAEEAKVQDLVSRTTEVLKQASAGTDDIGSRYARLLELLWKPKAPSNPPAETQQTNFSMQPALSNPVTDPVFMDFSPANDFSWLDLEAVGDYVSGDLVSGGLLGLDTFPNVSDMDQTGMSRTQSWQPSAWMGDMSSSLLF
jgi:hypothetical protein